MPKLIVANKALYSFGTVLALYIGGWQGLLLQSHRLANYNRKRCCYRVIDPRRKNLNRVICITNPARVAKFASHFDKKLKTQDYRVIDPRPVESTHARLQDYRVIDPHHVLNP